MIYDVLLSFHRTFLLDRIFCCNKADAIIRRQVHLSVNLILTFLSGRETKLVMTPSGGPSCSILNLCTILAIIMYSSSWANLLPMQDLAPWPHGMFAKGWAECLSLLSLSQRSGMNFSGLSKLQESLEVLWPILMTVVSFGTV